MAGVLKAQIAPGVWSPIIGGGGDPIWVGPDPPTDPTTEIWFDNDEIATSGFSPSTHWNVPWGLLAGVEDSTTTAGISTATAIPGLSFTFTSSVERIYKLFVGVTAQQFTAAGTIALQVYVDGIIVVGRAITLSTSTERAFIDASITLDSLTPDLHTVTMTLETSAGTVTYRPTGQGPAMAWVEDIGPITRIPAGTTVPGYDWTPYDDRYVNLTGDILTGGLTASHFTGFQMALNDDQAGYIEFASEARGLCAISGNISSSGNALFMFRTGASAQCSLMSSVGVTVTCGTGVPLTGVTGVDGQLTFRTNTGNNRLYIENRTAGVRGYAGTFLAMTASGGGFTVVP